jgi:cardiolipin synthase
MWFRAHKLRHIARFNCRDHRKLAIIDGRIGYAGGHCVVDTWLGNAESHDHVRDISVRVRGPIVHQLQSTFAENWVASTGELFVGDAVFPRLERVGETPAHIARISSTDLASDVKMLYYLLIACSRHSIRIQNAYFIPDPAAVQLLAAAVRRKVDVRIMSPAPSASDMPIVQHAARRTYAQLLEAGIQVYEFQKTLLHQKVIVVDGLWVGVGSSNFDDRSFEINHELVLGFCDAALAAEFEAIFVKDMQDCEKLDRYRWSQRSVKDRAIDRLAYLLNEQL